MKNETNPLEARLKSWLPRRPSPKLEQKLFGRKRPQHSHPMAWLAPATACLLLTFMVFSPQETVTLSQTERSGQLVVMSLSNQSYASYLPGSFQQTANRLDTFEWTNRGASTSSKRPLSPAKAVE